MRVLLVEDEAPKLANLKDFLRRGYPEFEVATAKSVRSAVDALRVHDADFAMVILDMSLPTFDIQNNESGGAPQGFGGLEVMRFMDRRGANIPVIVVTAYTAFDEGSLTLGLDDLRQKLLAEYPGAFRALVYYNVVYNTWTAELREAIDCEMKGQI